jgi:CubicO group peptidase (beta-lactamase class C family)
MLRSDAIRRLLAERVDDYRLSVGLAVGTSDHGNREYASYGYFDTVSRRRIDENTVFEIGSVTKLFTAVLLADMARRDEVSLDDPVALYLPSEVNIPEHDGQSITLAHLATHRSGLPRLPSNFAPANSANPYADYTPEHLYAFLSNYTLSRGVGQQVEYSNLGYALLGHALTRRAGMEYETLVKSRICGPLGLHMTAINLSDARARQFAPGHNESLDPVLNWDFNVFVAAGGIRSNSVDLLTFLEAFGSDSPLADAVEILKAPRQTGSAPSGLGIRARSDDGYSLIFHSGRTAGYNCDGGFIPEWKRAAIVLANATYGAREDLAIHMLDSRRPPHWYRREIDVDPDLFDRFVGRYRMRPCFILTVTRDQDRLFLQATGQGPLRLFPVSEQHFFCKAVGAQITFESGADYQAQRLILHQSSMDRIAERME